MKHKNLFFVWLVLAIVIAIVSCVIGGNTALVIGAAIDVASAIVLWIYIVKSNGGRWFMDL